jgi:hypothetical protein
MTMTALRMVDGSLPGSLSIGPAPTATAYCLQAVIGGLHWHIDRSNGAGAVYQTGDC